MTLARRGACRKGPCGGIPFNALSALCPACSHDACRLIGVMTIRYTYNERTEEWDMRRVYIVLSEQVLFGLPTLCQSCSLPSQLTAATEQYMMLPLAWQPFAKGGARVCYKARQLHRDGSTTLSVAKMFMTPHPREDYFNECMIQVRS